MGGRGSASGVSAKGIKYGKEYHTILAYENIKFITRAEGAANAPLETMSAAQNRVYVTVNNKDAIKSITIYDGEGKRTREIHFKEHHGSNPHAHDGYDVEHDDTSSPLTAADRRLINKVLKVWEEFENGI
jgi:hypothetical protein